MYEFESLGPRQKIQLDTNLHTSYETWRPEKLVQYNTPYICKGSPKTKKKKKKGTIHTDGKTGNGKRKKRVGGAK